MFSDAFCPDDSDNTPASYTICLLNIYDEVRTYAISNTIEGVYENPAYPTAVHYYDVTMK